MSLFITLLSFIAEVLTVTVSNVLMLLYVTKKVEIVYCLLISVIAMLIVNINTRNKTINLVMRIFMIMIAGVYLYSTISNDIYGLMKICAFVVALVYSLASGFNKSAFCILVMFPLSFYIYYKTFYLSLTIFLVLLSLICFFLGRMSFDGKADSKKVIMVLVMVFLSLLITLPAGLVFSKGLNPLVDKAIEYTNGERYYRAVFAKASKNAYVESEYTIIHLRKTAYGSYDNGKFYNNTRSKYFDDISLDEFYMCEEGDYSYTVKTIVPSNKVLTPYGAMGKDSLIRSIRDESYQFNGSVRTEYTFSFTPYRRLKLYETNQAIYDEYLDYLKKEYVKIPDYLLPTIRSFYKNNNLSTDASDIGSFLESLDNALCEGYNYVSVNRNTSDYKDRVETFLNVTKIGDRYDFNVAMIMLMRYAGIPCRYGEGYVVSDWRGDRGYFNVEEYTGWIEVYTEQYGWVCMSASIFVPSWYEDVEKEELAESQSRDGEDGVPGSSNGECTMCVGEPMEPQYSEESEINENAPSISSEGDGQSVETDVQGNTSSQSGESMLGNGGSLESADNNQEAQTQTEEPGKNLIQENRKKETREEEETATEQDIRNAMETSLKYVAFFIMLLGILSLLALIILLIIKRIKKKNQTIEDKIYDIYELLSKYDFCDKDTEALYKRVRFSNYPVTSNDFEIFLQKKEDLTEHIKKSCTLFKRILVRFKDGVKAL